MKNIIITGGAGFIGSHVVRLFVNKYSEYRIINVDVLTYAGNLENLSDIESAPNYVFERVDIVDAAAVDALFDKYQPEGVIHLAAESHMWTDSLIRWLLFAPTSWVLVNLFQQL